MIAVKQMEQLVKLLRQQAANQANGAARHGEIILGTTLNSIATRSTAASKSLKCPEKAS